MTDETYEYSYYDRKKNIYFVMFCYFVLYDTCDAARAPLRGWLSYRYVRVYVCTSDPNIYMYIHFILLFFFCFAMRTIRMTINPRDPLHGRLGYRHLRVYL